ncbi:MAG TPA: hypothetical protein VLW06_08040 [Terriglobales bacterium]|nr:hypothetical protein [Terriglobales bacterium]
MTRRTVLLAAAMVVASLGAAAQNSSSGAQNSPNTNNSSQRTVTVTGCLSSPGAGVYKLTDVQGKNYTLAGNTDALRGHSGQEIKATGQQPFTSGTSSNASSENSAAPWTIDVTRTTIVAAHCTSSSGSQPDPTAAGSSSSAASGARDSAQAATTGQGVAGVKKVALSEQSTGNNGQLPQTSTILPLLGLIGLGSLVAGFFARR